MNLMIMQPTGFSRSEAAENSDQRYRPSPLLHVRNLYTCFRHDGKLVFAVNGATFDVEQGCTTALIGESGSGKTVSALSVMGLIDAPPGITGGQILFEGVNLLEKLNTYCRVESQNGTTIVYKDIAGWRQVHQRRLLPLRGRAIGYIFQDPVSALSPYVTVRSQLIETLSISSSEHDRRHLEEEARRWLVRVHIVNPEEVLDAYQFQLSGGMAQRVMIALALAAKPRLLIADEPTTALDATVQRSILTLLKNLQEETGVGILLITHDIGLAANFADSVAVMYAGRIVESGPRSILFQQEALHPYTQSLLAGHTGARVPSGTIPDATRLPTGCAFHPRCERRPLIPDQSNQCEHREPPDTYDTHHQVRCWLFGTVGSNSTTPR